MLKKSGFTLIELIMVILILAILAVVAIPRFFNLQTQARASAEMGVVGGVRAGISTYYANTCVSPGGCSYPASLDDAADGACDPLDPCFDTVLAQGGITTLDWSKSGTSYTGPAGGVYTYDSVNGNFI